MPHCLAPRRPSVRCEKVKGVKENQGAEATGSFKELDSQTGVS